MDQGILLVIKKCYILGLGHPRTGTKYTATLLTEMGLDVGHEKLGSHGIVAWPLVSPTGPWPWVSRTPIEGVDPRRIVYNVRSPHESIPSIVYTDDKMGKSQEWRNHNIQMPYKKDFDNRVEYAIQSIIHFDRLIRQRKPDLIYRIEDQSNLLEDMVRKDRKYNRRRQHKDPGVMNHRPHLGANSLESEYQKVRPEYQSLINTYCDQYGYPKIF